MEIQSISNSGGAAYSPNVVTATDSKQHFTAEAVKPAAAPAASPVDAVQAVSPAPKPEELKESVSKINKAIQSISRDVEFSVDEDTRMNVVKVVDAKTKEVIRQFPSEEVLAIAKALDKLQGLLLKEKA